MQIGQDSSGMITMNQSIKKHVESGLISPETAVSYSTVPEEMMQMLGMKKTK